MLAEVEGEGVLSIVPESQQDVRELKWFLKEFATHGNKMINVVTDLEKAKEYLRKKGYGRNSRYSHYDVEGQYGYDNRRRNSWYEDDQPFSPQGYYDQRPDSDREHEVVFPKDKEYVNRYYTDNPRRGQRSGEAGRNN